MWIVRFDTFSRFMLLSSSAVESISRDTGTRSLGLIAPKEPGMRQGAQRYCEETVKYRHNRETVR